MTCDRNTDWMLDCLLLDTRFELVSAGDMIDGNTEFDSIQIPIRFDSYSIQFNSNPIQFDPTQSDPILIRSGFCPVFRVAVYLCMMCMLVSNRIELN